MPPLLDILRILIITGMRDDMDSCPELAGFCKLESRHFSKNRAPVSGPPARRASGRRAWPRRRAEMDTKAFRPAQPGDRRRAQSDGVSVTITVRSEAPARGRHGAGRAPRPGPGCGCRPAAAAQGPGRARPAQEPGGPSRSWGQLWSRCQCHVTRDQVMLGSESPSRGPRHGRPGAGDSDDHCLKGPRSYSWYGHVTQGHV